MKLYIFLMPSMAYAFECSRKAFQTALPMNITASVAYATSVPKNFIFEVPKGDIAFPTSPVLIRKFCTVQITITSSPSSYFYRKVLNSLIPKGIEADSWYRYFHVPGIEHCAGTATNAPWYFAGAIQANTLGLRPGSVSGVPGCRDSEHDILLALMRWTEEGQAPDRIVATKWHSDILQDEVLRRRPFCPYPNRARRCGHGNLDDAANWRCSA